MVAFGKGLHLHAVSEWQRYYVRYDELKAILKKLKSMASSTDGQNSIVANLDASVINGASMSTSAGVDALVSSQKEPATPRTRAMAARARSRAAHSRFAPIRMVVHTMPDDDGNILIATSIDAERAPDEAGGSGGVPAPGAPGAPASESERLAGGVSERMHASNSTDDSADAGADKSSATRCAEFPVEHLNMEAEARWMPKANAKAKAKVSSLEPKAPPPTLDLERKFFRCLDADVEKVQQFFELKLQEFRATVVDLEDQAGYLRAHLPDSVSNLRGGADDDTGGSSAEGRSSHDPNDKDVASSSTGLHGDQRQRQQGGLRTLLARTVAHWTGRSGLGSGGGGSGGGGDSHGGGGGGGIFQDASAHALQEDVGARLIDAAARGNAAEASILLETFGADPSGVDYDRRSAAHLAAAHGQIEVLQLLHAAGADIAARDRWGCSPMKEAVRHRRTRTIEWLVSKGQAIEPDDRQHVEELCDRVFVGDAAGVESLCRSGVDPSAGDYDLRTALHVAAAQGDEDLTAILLRYGANPEATDRWGRVPWHEAAAGGHKETMALLEPVTSSSARNNYVPPSPTSQQHAQDLQQLAADALTPKVVNAGGDSSRCEFVHHHGVPNTSFHGHVATAVGSGGGGDSGHEGDPRGITSTALGRAEFVATRRLVAAAFAGRLKDVKRLLKDGANPGLSDYGGRTALHLAARSGHAAVVKLLLAQPATRINAQDHHSGTPLMDALENGHTKCVALLRRAGAALVHKRRAGHKLCAAAARGDIRALQRLRDLEVDLNSRNYDGRTALHLAAAAGADATVKWLLLQDGVRVEPVDRFGNRPVDDATQRATGQTGRRDVCVHLLLTAAKVEAENTGDSAVAADAQQRDSVRNRKAVTMRRTGLALVNKMRNMRLALSLSESGDYDAGRAKHQIKFGLLEVYRGISMLRNYCVMNWTAVAKITKKHDKVCGWATRARYLEAAEAVPFRHHHELKELGERAERAYAQLFHGGSRKKALASMARRVGSASGGNNHEHHFVFAAGVLGGYSLAVALLLAVIFAVHGRPFSTLVGFEAAWPLFRVSYWLLLHFLGFGINMLVFERCSVNYRFIFSFNPSGGALLTPARAICCALAGLALTLTLFLMHTLSCVVLQPERDAGSSHTESMFGTVGDQLAWARGWVPAALAIAWLLVLLNPIGERYSARRFRHVLRKLLCAPFAAVRFEDFFLGDQLTSQSRALADIAYVACWLGTGRTITHVAAQCDADTVELARWLPMLPYWLRFAQCCRRFYDQPAVVEGHCRLFCWEFPQKWHHLHNAAKYASSLLVVIVSAVSKHSVLWWVAILWSTCFSLFWDLWFDWGLLRQRNWGDDNFLLREDLMYANPGLYYVAMLLDVILRFIWIASVLPHALTDEREHRAIWLFVVGTLEVLRRVMWNFFRLENEQLHNIGGFRAVQEVPLPFHHDKDFQERLQQVKALKSAAQDRRRSFSALGSNAQSLPRRRNKNARTMHPGTVAPVIVVHGKEQVKDV